MGCLCKSQLNPSNNTSWTYRLPADQEEVVVGICQGCADAAAPGQAALSGEFSFGLADPSSHAIFRDYIVDQWMGYSARGHTRSEYWMWDVEQ